MTSGQEKWDQHYQVRSTRDGVVATVLQTYQHLLPQSGQALDLACGVGGNAQLLAEHGLETQAWDISTVAISRLGERATSTGLQVKVRDVTVQPPEPASFDVIVVSRFLNRALCPVIEAALKPDGLLYYQTFIRDKLSDTGPDNVAYRLAPNELLRLFPNLLVLAYHEEGRVGDTARGLRNEAMLVAQRTATTRPRHCGV